MPLPEGADRTGFEENTNYVTEFIGKFVPQRLARRAIAVSVATDRQRYDPGEPVEVTIEFLNRLPVPIVVETPRRRLWGWSVDGDLAASDERVFTREHPGRFEFRARERKRVTRRWDGRFKRTDGETRWETAAPGEHEIRAFLAVEGHRPTDATTVTIE